MFSSICMYTVHSNKQAWIQDLLWNPDHFLGFATFWWDPDHFCGIRVSLWNPVTQFFSSMDSHPYFFLFKIIYFDTGHGLTKIIFYSYTVNLKLDKSETWRTFSLNLKSKLGGTYYILYKSWRIYVFTRTPVHCVYWFF